MGIEAGAARGWEGAGDGASLWPLAQHPLFQDSFLQKLPQSRKMGSRALWLVTQHRYSNAGEKARCRKSKNHQQSTARAPVKSGTHQPRPFTPKLDSFSFFVQKALK